MISYVARPCRMDLKATDRVRAFSPFCALFFIFNISLPLHEHSALKATDPHLRREFEERSSNEDVTLLAVKTRPLL